MTDGLKDEHRTAIVNLLRSNERVDRAVLFGSRATETFTLGSDVDIALFGEELTTTDQARLVAAMEKLNVPQRIDLLLYDQVEDAALRAHVHRDGVELYRRPNDAAARFHALEDWRRSGISSLARRKNGLAFEVDLLRFDQLAEINPATEMVKGEVRPFIEMADLPPHARDISSFSTRRFKGSGSRFRNGDTLIARITPCLENGKGALISCLPDRLAGFGSSEFIVARAHQSSDKKFVYYVTRSESFRKVAISRMEGTSGRQRVSWQQIANIEIPDLPLTLREKIGDILSALDDKIDLNRRMNETLEAMARAVFKDWFVDFGPTRARMEGREPYLPPELWDLFPDALDGQGKPAGWTFSEIGEEAEVVGGGTPSTKELSYWDGGMHHWATPKDLSKLTTPVLLRTERKITDAGVNKISSGLLPVGAILMSSRAPIGYLAITEIPTAVNQGFIAMVCRQRLPNTFVLFWCQANLDYIKDIAGGSTFAEISKRTFRPVPVLVPSVQILAAYDRLVRPLYVRIVANAKESDTLARTRDILLPKLMSGEISLRDVERATEAVA